MKLMISMTLTLANQWVVDYLMPSQRDILLYSVFKNT